MTLVTIRQAQLTDISALVEFNQAMAEETEGRQLDGDVLRLGVETLVKQPSLGFYLVAELQEQVVAGLMVTREWSDWRNGVFWWIQSVYVLPAFRRRGIYRELYRFVQRLARQENVCGFRLYVERDNYVAQQTYQALGMEEAVYKMFEQMVGQGYS